MLLAGLTPNNKIIKKAIFRISEYSTRLDITYYNHQETEIISEGYLIQEKKEITHLQKGLEQQG